MKENRSGPTLEDVAKLAGVSTATVSRCLNSPERVVESTREKVHEAVRSLGYVPNFGARVLAANRTNTIGAVIPTMENAIFARGIQAFQESLHDRGYTLLVASSSYSLEMEQEQIRTLVARGADGLLLIGHDRKPEAQEILRIHRVPALVAWSHDPKAKLPSIGFDNRTAMKSLAREAISLGHRRIGMISAETAENDRARLRVEGVRDACREAGIPEHDLSVVETEYGFDTGAAGFARLMDSALPPSLVICGNDVLAVGAMICARQRGIAIPDDVSITGFDDIDLAHVAVPGLTTVQVPHREMGRRAALMLVSMVETGAPGESIKLETTICRRASLGPCRKS